MSGQNSDSTPQRRPLVHIPSFSEVHDARPSKPVLNLFRPSSEPASTLRPHTSPENPGGTANNVPVRSTEGSSHVASAPVAAVPHQSAAAPPAQTHGSFTQAFSFVRNSEFYTPPPPGPPLQASSGGSNLARGQPGPSGSAQSTWPRALQSQNAIIVSKRQQGNPVLKNIRNVRWQFGDVVPDYVLGASSCALYLSLRYHLLHPDYLYFRIRELQKGFRLRVVLCHVDVDDVIKPLHEVTKTALLNECTLLCAWSVEECARYLETIKSYENKPAELIQERTDNDYLSRLTSALTTVRHVNKTDVLTLGSNFEGVMGASMEELARCPGIGERKVKRLYDAFHEPFRRTSKQLRLSNVGISRAQLAAPPAGVAALELVPSTSSQPTGRQSDSQPAAESTLSLVPSPQVEGAKGSGATVDVDVSKSSVAGDNEGVVKSGEGQKGDAESGREKHTLSVREALDAAKARVASMRAGTRSAPAPPSGAGSERGEVGVQHR
eukprot:jgi/Mesen1/9366/ME000061S08805